MKKKLVILTFVALVLCGVIMPRKAEAAVNGAVYTNLPISNNCSILGHAVDYGTFVTSSSIDFSKTKLVYVHNADGFGLYKYMYYETNGMIDIPYDDGYTYTSSSSYPGACTFNHITNQYE